MPTPSLATLIKKAIELKLLDVNTALIARVEKYDSERQTVDVQPVLSQKLENRDGGLVAKEFPILPDVPVLFPRTKNFFIALPIFKGDYVQVIFNQCSIDEWWLNAQENREGAHGTHRLSGAVAIPGVYPKNDALKLPTVDDLVLGNTNGAQICISASEVKLGSNTAMEPVALADKVLAELQKIAAAFNGHVHANMGADTPKTPVSVNSVAATKVKAVVLQNC